MISSTAVNGRGYSPGLGLQAVRLKLRQMFFRPPAKPLQRLNQGTPQLGKRIFHFRRHDRMNSASHKTVALQAAQRLGKHFLRDSADLAQKRGIPDRTAGKNLDDERSPFVSNAVEHQPRGTAWVEYRRNRRTLWHDFCVKRVLNRCKQEGNIPTDVYSRKPSVVDCWFRSPKLNHEHHSS